MIIGISTEITNYNCISITDLNDSDIFKTLDLDGLKIGNNINLQISIGAKDININGVVKNIDTDIKEYNSTKGFIKIRNTIIDFK